MVFLHFFKIFNLYVCKTIKTTSTSLPSLPKKQQPTNQPTNHPTNHPHPSLPQKIASTVSVVNVFPNAPMDTSNANQCKPRSSAAWANGATFAMSVYLRLKAGKAPEFRRKFWSVSKPDKKTCAFLVLTCTFIQYRQNIESPLYII